MVMLILLGLAVALLVSALKSNPQIERDKITADALAKAKDALIGYAATYGDRNDKRVFGHLPCPDLGTGTEGSEAPSCSEKDISALGRLPWKSLGLPPLRDSSGECLWYAVSGSFKSNTKPDLLNWDSDGQFQILADDGATPMAGTSSTVFDGTHPAAVIFSAGAPLSGQNRTPAASSVSECGGNYTASNYLDTLAGISNSAISATANAITQFITGKTSNTFNDRLLYITANEIFAKRIEKRKDFPGVYFSDATNLTPTILNNFTLVGGYRDNIDTQNQTIAGISTNPPVYGLLQKTAQCLVKYGKNNSTATDKRLPWAAPLNIADFANDNFDDSAGLLAGRPPFVANNSAAAAPANLLVTSSNSWRLPTIARCTIGWENVAGAGGTTSKDGWWDKWKDHLFYAVADAFKPTSTAATQTYPCNSLQSGGNCLWVDHGGVTGVKGPYAAVLIYAGKKLASPAQSRDTLAQKIVAGNYLEGANATSIAAGNGNNIFTKTTGNDVLLCVSQDLSIDPGCQNPVVYSGPPPGSDYSFSNNISSFDPAGSGGGSQVTINADGSATLYITGASNKSGCFWFPTANALYNKTMRAYFKFRFRDTETSTTSSSHGDGITFTVLPGSANVAYVDGMCGDTNKSGYSGSDGGGHAPLPLPTTNLAIEYDVFYNSAYADPSPANKNHIAVLTGSLDHSGISFSSPCDGTTAGCYPASTPNWLEDNVYHQTRIEVFTGCDNTCSTCNASGAYSLVRAWVDCTNCRDLNASFTGTPGIQSCISTSSWLNSTNDTVKFGFTSGESAGVRQTIDLSDFGVNFE